MPQRYPGRRIRSRRLGLGSAIIMVATASCALLAVVTLAVDQSKFRTCDKTSFCRRHRQQHSARLYKYQLLRDSVAFHKPEEERGTSAVGKQTKGNTNGAGSSSGGGSSSSSSSIWKSLQERLLSTTATGKKNGDDEDAYADRKDPFFRGTPPTLTGTLRNIAPETSTGVAEQLDWSLHAMADGLVRLRIIEPYSEPGTPSESAHAKARVTYDDLVLSTDTLLPANHAQWMQHPATDAPGLWSQIVDTGTADANAPQNYMILLYGDKDDESNKVTSHMALVIRLDPFSLYLYRQDEEEALAGPIVTLGEADRMHFEIRRFKDGAKNKAAADADAEAEKQADVDRHGGKEIVGYWEDGLAIYADGTREERKNDEVDSDHRKLSEADLDREGMWEEHFEKHHDSKPYGPMSVGMDVSFPHSKHLFGLPEHASSNKLKTTSGEGSEYSEPYRMYNLDVFEYDLDVPMALYGSVPLVVSQSKTTGTSGVFWFNPSETFVDILNHEENNGMMSHWISESGVVDVMLIPGPTPMDLYRQYAKLTGTMPLPPMFSLGYHQCRWNYKDEQDVYQVHGKFEELDYPYDVLWLDIEHTDGKRYFTWDSNLFPNPKEMQEKLWSQGRRMVTIIDPHIKRDDKYYVHKDATSLGLYVKDKDGKKDYDGWCWPGSSSYLDFTSTKVRAWWADQFAYDRYQGSSPSLFTWNDMNEPSVFNGPEVSMQKDLRNLRGDEHREWHNLYGMLFHRASAEGLIKRSTNKSGEQMRPFVLSRSFFAGSQQYGAIWTGDNAAEWSHLEIASPMLLSLNVGALSFVGADVGGFFGNTDAELMTRWMQAGAYTPFFRGHAHHDAKRREPWMFGTATMTRLRHAAMARYALLPFWYTTFREAGQTGMPVMRSMWMHYPKTEELYSVDDQYLIGSSLLVKPVTAPGITQSTVIFPTDDTWYDAETLVVVSSKGAIGGVAQVTVPSDIDTIPVFQRGGSILPRKLRLRRSSHLMQHDPYTLYVALSHVSGATGILYMDDEQSFGYASKQAYAEAFIVADLYSTGTIHNVVRVGAGWEDQIEKLSKSRMVERIVVAGMKAKPKAVTEVNTGAKITVSFDADRGVLVMRQPRVSMLHDWSIRIEM